MVGKKKPTIREVAGQVEMLTQEMGIARARIINLENLLVKYFEYNKHDEKFKKYLDKEAEKYAKDGADGSIRDDKQQEVLESKWST